VPTVSSAAWMTNGEGIAATPEDAFREIMKPRPTGSRNRRNLPPRAVAASKKVPAGRSSRIAAGKRLLAHSVPRKNNRQTRRCAAETPCKAVAALRAAADRLAAEWGQRLTELHVRLIERPGLRLAGAEEGIRHVVASIRERASNTMSLCSAI